MNAPGKVEAAANLRIWDAVSKTDPRHTKKVSQRGGFTAISAHYQVMSATAAFGPVGEGWGYTNGEPIWHDNLVVIPVTLWHGDRANCFGPVYGSAEVRNAKGYLDADAPKKAATDGLTKALSHLGFNADVFLGRFDDNKYVAELTREFTDAGNEEPPEKRVKLEGPYTSPSKLKAAIKAFAEALRTYEDDLAGFTAWMETPEVVELEKQAMRDLPAWWETGEGMPEEFEPMTTRIHRKKRALEELETLHNVRTPIDAG